MQDSVGTSTALLSTLKEIKKLESTFASVLMEVVLKLVKLTDSEIFILIENESMGRCFGGSKLFCDDYRGNGLRETLNDLWMEVDLDVSSLSAKRIDDSSQPMNRHYSLDPLNNLSGVSTRESAHDATFELRKCNETNVDGFTRRKRKGPAMEGLGHTKQPKLEPMDDLPNLGDADEYIILQEEIDELTETSDDSGEGDLGMAKNFEEGDKDSDKVNCVAHRCRQLFIPPENVSKPHVEIDGQEFARHWLSCNYEMGRTADEHIARKTLYQVCEPSVLRAAHTVGWSVHP